MANRRWFDQPLGDQNLRPVHDGQYGLIAGSSTGQHQFKSELAEKNSVERNMPVNISELIIKRKLIIFLCFSRKMKAIAQYHNYKNIIFFS